MSISTTSPIPGPVNYFPDPPSSNSLPTRPSDGPERNPLRRRGPLRTLLDDRPRSSSTQVPTGLNLERAPSRVLEPKYFALSCGGHIQSSEEQIMPSDDSKERMPSLFPPFANNDERVPRKSSTPRSHTNGCGTLLHLRAAPKARLGVFTAKSFTNSSEAVLMPLDTKYFADLDFQVGGSGSVQLVKSSCGCERIGIGCAVCGNPLGTRFKPCKNATNGTDFALRHINTKPLGPEGRAYWRVMKNKANINSPPSTQLPSTEDDFTEFYVYTFFPAAVTSYPHFSFPTSSLGQPYSSSSGSSTTSFQQTFFVDSSSPSPPQAGYVRDSGDYLERRIGNPSTIWTGLGDEWQPPSPVRLTFVEQRDNRFSNRGMRSANDVAMPVEGLQESSRRGWSDSEPSALGSGNPDDWDKDIWENRVDVISGR